MDYFSLFTGIFTLAVGLFGLIVLFWRYARNDQSNKITRTAAIVQAGLSVILVLLGSNSLLQYYNLGNGDAYAILSLIALFGSVCALLFMLWSQRTHRK